MRERLRNFMSGRYGPDHLNAAICVVVLVLWFINIFVRELWLELVGTFLLIISVYRMFSRNIPKRRAENDRFIRWWWPIRQKVTGFIQRRKDSKNYCFFKCPACKNMLRLPRGKGKIMITCPKCGERFQKKT